MIPSLLSPLIQIHASVSGDEAWSLLYAVDVKIPPWAANLTFVLSWRLEYSSYIDSIADYPTITRSFQGAPTGMFVLPNFEKRVIIYPNDKVVVHGPWLRRKSTSSEWVYYQNQNSDNELSKSCKRAWNETRPYSVLIVGDSQPNYMCEHLATYGSTPTKCVSLKGNFTNVSRTQLGDFSTRYSNVLNQAQEDVVIFNTQGLWETAYGQLSVYPSRLDTVLDSIPSRKDRSTHFFLTTTAVHPNNYKRGIFTDDTKWAMTQPRVQAINSASKERINAFSNRDIFTLDIEALSLLREDDPLVEGDMRHYGSHTNEMLLSYILCEVDRHLIS